MFINLTNHSSAYWSEEQLEKARMWGEVVDLPFPVVDPFLDRDGIAALARDYSIKCLDMLTDNEGAVHVMGEHTLTYALVNELKRHGVLCLASTSQRSTIEENGSKLSEFSFCIFREY